MAAERFDVSGHLLSISKIVMPEVDQTNNKRLHIQFYHHGLMPMLIQRWGGKKKVEDIILGSIWSEFGNVINPYYHSEYSYCFLSFPSHHEAKLALESLNQAGNVNAAIQKFITIQGNEAAKSLVEQITGVIFQRNRLGGISDGSLLRASWASGH